jgi:DNA-binding NarL/FixJ family response regulator
VAAAARTAPSLVIIDPHHPGRDGIGLCFTLKAMVPTPTVLVYSGSTYEHVRLAAHLAGADGFVGKFESRRALLEGIRLAARRRGGPVPVAPSQGAQAALQLNPTDRAIFAMRLAGTSLHDIATTTEQRLSVVAERLASIASRLSYSASPEQQRGARAAVAPSGDPPRMRGRPAMRSRMRRS